MKSTTFEFALLIIASLFMFSGCGNGNGNGSGGAMSNTSAAEKVYVAPGEYDEYYEFFSGGFSGQVTVHGLPSGRLLKTIPVFSVDGEKGYGFNEETKPMLMTTFGFVPWDDSHHPKLSQTEGVHDGNFLFINGNNTPRIARIDLTTFETTEILQIPNTAGLHASPYPTQNTEYLVAGTRFSVPIPQQDVSIDTYKENFKGTFTFISGGQEPGKMDVAFQILAPGYDYDLAHSGKGVSHGWSFFTSYNVEQENSIKEKYASQYDKDYIAAVNWKKAEEYIAQGKFEEWPSEYYHNFYSDKTHTATSTLKKGVKVLIPSECPGLVYYLPTPKSPHGVDVSPTGEFIVGSGKLSQDLTVHSFAKMLAAIEAENFDDVIEGIPVLNFEAVLAGTVSAAGIGPLHTEFDGRGHGYTSFFISSTIVKWSLETFEMIDEVSAYYSIGHLSIPGGGSMKPWENGKYLIAMNKITKDRYLPTGPELAHSAQLYDISGDRMELLLDFPTMGEPHYAQGILASKIIDQQVKFFRLEDNEHQHKTLTQAEARVERNGNEVHIYGTMIRSHFAPDNIEGIKVGDKVYWHITNLEQDWDVPHGLGVMGANNSELLIMPGQTETLLWEPKTEGIYPFYCTDFCSALHQEMQGYVRVSAKNSNTKMKWTLKDEVLGE
jgi:nitrous-oxide reductase